MKNPWPMPDHHAGRDHRAGRELAELELCLAVLAGCVLGREGGLDAVEQAFKPAHQLGLRDAQLRVGGCGLIRERKAEPVQLFHQFGSQPVFQFLDGALMDLGQPAPRGIIERCRLHLFKKLPDHGADPHHLRRFVNQSLQAAAFGLAAVRLAGARNGLGRPAGLRSSLGRHRRLSVIDGGALYREVLRCLSVFRIAHAFILS